MSSPGNTLFGSQHLGESGVRGGQAEPLSSRIASQHPDFQEGEGVFVCGGAQLGLPWARGPGLCGPHLWGTPHPDSIPAWVVGAAGVEIQLREVGGQPGMVRKRWAPGRTWVTGQVGSGHVGDHSRHPLWPAGQQGVSGGPTLSEC